jgi:transcription termination factor Rho
MYDIIELNNNDITNLRDIAKKLEIDDSDKLAKQDLIFKILDKQALMSPSEVARIKNIGKTAAEPVVKEPEEVPEAKPEAEEKPKARRGRKKKTEAADSPEEEEKEKKPAPRKRSTKKKTEDTEEVKAEKPTEEAKEKPEEPESKDQSADKKRSRCSGRVF